MVTPSMLDHVKSKALTAKRAASDAVLAASSAVRQGLGAAQEKGYEVSLKAPLVTSAPAIAPPEIRANASSDQLVPLVAHPAAAGPELEAAGPCEQFAPLLADSPACHQPVKLHCLTVKQQLMMAGCAAKARAERVRHKCDVAAARAAGKVITAASTAKEVKGKCDVRVGAVMNKIDIVQARLFGSSALLGVVEAECVDMLVAMGFPRQDAAHAVRRVGTDDVNSIVEFLCQEPGQKASSPDWNSRIAACIARRMVEMELDAEEDMQMALALSKFQAEAAQAHGRNLVGASSFAPFHCWDDSQSSTQNAVHITGIVCPHQDLVAPFHLRPSVGTWMQPLYKAPKAPHTPELS